MLSKVPWLGQLRHICFYVCPGAQLRSSRLMSSLLLRSVGTLYRPPNTYYEVKSMQCPAGGPQEFLRWSSTLQATTNHSIDEISDLLSFFESHLSEIQSLNHCWLNMEKDKFDNLPKENTHFIVVGNFLEDEEMLSILETAKLLLQRFPWLCIIGIHAGKWDSSSAFKADIVELVLHEFITFPILFSRTIIEERHNNPYCIYYKDSVIHRIYKGKDIQLKMLEKDIEDLKISKNHNYDASSEGAPIFKRAWYKPVEVTKEPSQCSPLQNLLLSVPGGVSSDEYGGRLFVSDTNHHRVIVTDKDGRILDCVGSTPGFSDGEFAYAKFLRPTSTLYDDATDCLFIVDSENHAIRRADMNRRVVETLFPISMDDKETEGFFRKIMKKLKFRSNSRKLSNDHTHNSLLFPWHLLRSLDSDLIVITRNFEKLWVLDAVSGEIKDFVNGYSEVLKTHEELLNEKISLLSRIPSCLKCQSVLHPSNLSFLSSITSFDESFFIYSNESSCLLKINAQSGQISKVNLSNFALLGFPYWLTLPEKLNFLSPLIERRFDHIEHCKVLPGRITIRVHLSIPNDTILVEPLEEEQIWYQSRGAATVFNRVNDISETLEKAGVAQQWYDELDKLTFAASELDNSPSSNDAKSSLVKWNDGVLSFGCVANASPGTCEVLISVPLYLKVRTTGSESRQWVAAKLADLLDSGGMGEDKRSSCCEFLMTRGGDLWEVVFVRPMNAKVKLSCLDYPKGESFKELLLNDTTVDLNISL